MNIKILLLILLNFSYLFSSETVQLYNHIEVYYKTENELDMFISLFKDLNYVFKNKQQVDKYRDTQDCYKAVYILNKSKSLKDIDKTFLDVKYTKDMAIKFLGAEYSFVKI